MAGMGKYIVLGVLLGLLRAEQTGSIEGIVREQDGTAAPGIQVALLNFSADGPILRETVTDEEGRYVFDGLVPGSYAVVHELGPCSGVVRDARDRLARCADLSGEDAGLARRHVQQWLRDTTADRLHRIDAAAGHRTRCDLELPASTQLTLLLRSPLGAVADVDVRLVPVPYDYYPVWPVEIPASDLRQDESGVFTFPRVPLGRYIPEACVGPWKLLWQVLEVGATAPLSRELEPGRYAIRLRIVDARGERVASARPRTSGAGLMVGAVTDVVLDPSRDWFEVPYAVAGTHRAWAEAGNVRTREVTGMEVGPDAPHPEATLHLPPAGGIRVRISARAGHAPASVVVSVQRRGDLLPMRQAVPSNGEVLFGPLYEGTYLVESGERPSFLPREAEPVEADVTAFEITDVTLVLPDGDE